MADLDFGPLVTPQTNLAPQPVSIAGAVTIAPTTLLTVITGTGTVIATVTPPVTGCHILVMVFTNAAPNTFSAAGNLQRAFTPLQNVPVFLIWDPRIAKYYVMGYAS